MQERFPRGRSAIVGAATFGCGAAPGYSAMELAHQASVLALAGRGDEARQVLTQARGLYAAKGDVVSAGKVERLADPLA